MKAFLVLAVVACIVALANSAPGMRGNGASGATRDIDPENPNVSGSAANAAASGNNPSASTYSEKKNGLLYSIAQAKNSAGSSVAQTSGQGGSSSAISTSRGGSAVASAHSSRGYSEANAMSSGGSPADGSSVAAVRG